MQPLVTVLYEDSKVGPAFPLHFLVLRMVEDDIDGQTWKLRKLVLDNPRKGIEHLDRTRPEGARPDHPVLD